MGGRGAAARCFLCVWGRGCREAPPQHQEATLPGAWTVCGWDLVMGLGGWAAARAGHAAPRCPVPLWGRGCSPGCPGPSVGGALEPSHTSGQGAVALDQRPLAQGTLAVGAATLGCRHWAERSASRVWWVEPAPLGSLRAQDARGRNFCPERAWPQRGSSARGTPAQWARRQRRDPTGRVLCDSTPVRSPAESDS